MTNNKHLYWRRVLILFLLGFLGVVSFAPVIPKLTEISGQASPLPMFLIQVIATAQSSILLFAMVMLGAWLSPKVNLGTPVLDAWLTKSFDSLDLKKVVLPGLLWGIVGGVILIILANISTIILPEEFIENGNALNPPFYSRILYGGITEELLMRWGIMSFLAWGVYRITQPAKAAIGGHNYIIAIVISAVLFGVGHLPVAFTLFPDISAVVILYILVGNSLFGIIAGFLYWKRGLEAAILAHMVAHGVMFFAEYILLITEQL